MSLRQGAQSPGGYLPNDAGATGEFGVDLHTMMAAADHVDHVSSALSGEVNRLMTRLEELIGSSTSWEGSAAAAFRDAQERWVVAHRKLSGTLGDIAGGLRTSGTHYDRSEQESQSGITSAAQGLEPR
jgi:WXG100 family type VII secretion target